MYKKKQTIMMQQNNLNKKIIANKNEINAIRYINDSTL